MSTMKQLMLTLPKDVRKLIDEYYWERPWHWAYERGWIMVNGHTMGQIPSYLFTIDEVFQHLNCWRFIMFDRMKGADQIAFRVQENVPRQLGSLLWNVTDDVDVRNTFVGECGNAHLYLTTWDVFKNYNEQGDRWIQKGRWGNDGSRHRHFLTLVE